MARLLRAQYRRDHRVWLEFDDGVTGEVDLADQMWGEVFEPLKDPAVFAAFRVDGTLVWENGADLAPEFLHDLAASATREGS
jgi:hypothetical protein